ncbi:MAG: hypothetical protein WAV07_03700 [Candidatus Contendobacter sp.]
MTTALLLSVSVAMNIIIRADSIQMGWRRVLYGLALVRLRKAGLEPR